MPLRPKSERILYKDAGILEATLNGTIVRGRHSEPGRSGYEVFWDGQWYSWLYAGFIEEEFGIEVRTKKTGSQKGYPAESVTRAVWRHLVDRYNACDTDVKYWF